MLRFHQKCATDVLNLITRRSCPLKRQCQILIFPVSNLFPPRTTYLPMKCGLVRNDTFHNFLAILEVIDKELPIQNLALYFNLFSNIDYACVIKK